MLDTIKLIGWSGRHICRQLLIMSFHSVIFFIDICNNALYNPPHSLIRTLYLAIFSSNGQWIWSVISVCPKSYTKSWQSSMKPSVAFHTTSDHLQQEEDLSSNNKWVSIGTQECLIICRSSACSEWVLLQGGGSLQQAAATTGTTACIKKWEIVKYCSVLCEFALVHKVHTDNI